MGPVLIVIFPPRLDLPLCIFERREPVLFQALLTKSAVEAFYVRVLDWLSGSDKIQLHPEAVRWYRKAADQGNARGQHNLGIMCEIGQGVPQDYAEAAKWYRKAAEQGDANAQSNLGIMYAKGQGLPQNYVLAHMWYNIAALRYPASEKEDREQAVRNRDLISSKMTPAQIAEAQRLVQEWKLKMQQ